MAINSSIAAGSGALGAALLLWLVTARPASGSGIVLTVVRRALQALGAWLIVIRMANLVDEGFTRGWPAWGRFGWVAIMIYGTVFAMLSVVTLIDTNDDPDSGWHGVVRGIYIGVAVLLGLFLVAKFIETQFGIQADRLLWVALGLGVGWCTAKKPWWYWEHWKAQFLRNLIGDRATTFVYGLMAIVMIAIGLFTNTPIRR